MPAGHSPQDDGWIIVSTIGSPRMEMDYRRSPPEKFHNLPLSLLPSIIHPSQFFNSGVALSDSKDFDNGMHENPPFRVGTGYDIHQFVRDRPLVLGGVSIESDFGLLGHSDADCLTHAMADAILGAAGCEDIGTYFANDDPQWKGMNSQIILKKASEEARSRGWLLANIDAMVIAERPKLKKYFPEMKSILAATLEIEVTQVGLKATTNEGIGSLGRAEGIAAYVTCLLWRG